MYVCMYVCCMYVCMLYACMHECNQICHTVISYINLESDKILCLHTYIYTYTNIHTHVHTTCIHLISLKFVVFVYIFGMYH